MPGVRWFSGCPATPSQHSSSTRHDQTTCIDDNGGQTWGLGVELAERLEIIDAEVIASQVQHCILEGACVSIGEDKAVAVDPLGVV
jgi:hypothetical protein